MDPKTRQTTWATLRAYCYEGPLSRHSVAPKPAPSPSPPPPPPPPSVTAAEVEALIEQKIAAAKFELLTGRIKYPTLHYDGYGDGSSVVVADFVSEEMKADWRAHREALIRFWKSEQFTDDLPWLFVRGSADTLPWAVCLD